MGTILFSSERRIIPNSFKPKKLLFLWCSILALHSLRQFLILHFGPGSHAAHWHDLQGNERTLLQFFRRSKCDLFFLPVLIVRGERIGIWEASLEVDYTTPGVVLLDFAVLKKPVIDYC